MVLLAEQRDHLYLVPAIKMRWLGWIHMAGKEAKARIKINKLLEEAAELANYLPLSFKTPKEQEYIEFFDPSDVGRSRI